MTDRAQRWAAGLAAIDFAHFSLAEALDQEAASGSWKDYVYPMDYPLESKQGKHPSTFGGFLEGHAFDLQAQGHQVSRGDLETSLDIYRWCKQIGASTQQMGYLGLALLKRIYKQYRKQPLEAGAKILAEAFASKQEHGRYFLPSFGPPEATPRFAVETTDMGDGTYMLTKLIVTKDGRQYVNRWPKELLHYLTVRLRASNITKEQ